MAIDATQALWFLPFMLPICLYVPFTDMAQMRITNQAVVLMVVVFVAVGVFLMPFTDVLWRLAAMVAVLIIGILLNAVGALGAGDAKFAAAATPFITLGDLRLIMALFMATMMAAVVSHRVIKRTALRRLAPDWESWHQTKKFPMGLALGPALAIYLILGALYGVQ